MLFTDIPENPDFFRNLFSRPENTPQKALALAPGGIFNGFVSNLRPEQSLRLSPYSAPAENIFLKNFSCALTLSMCYSQ